MTQQGPTIKSWQFRKLRGLLSVALFALACALAGAGLTAEPTQKRFVIEHYALAGAALYLDGPREQALSSVHRQGVCDADGNLYIQDWYGTSIRCARLDGKMVTIIGDDTFGGGQDLEEGPASCMPALDSPAQSFGSTIRTVVAWGRPLAGGDKGALYVLGSRRSGSAGKVFKVWKNPDQGNRWWFRRVAGGGQQPLPTKEGEAVAALEAKMVQPRFTADVGGSNGIYICESGSAYRFDEQKGQLTCVLSCDSYRNRVQHWNGKSFLGPAEEIIIADDGTAYLHWYHPSYPRGMIARMSADRSKVELIVVMEENKQRRDGAGLGSYWFGGPQMNGYQPPDVVLAGAVDDHWLRRYKDGRISTLCPDGEWREFGPGRPPRPMDLYAGFGTNGWAMHRNYAYVYRTYGSKSDGANTIIRFGPVDWHKPTLEPLIGVSK
jgi:hypothetical protein